ncbi:MAG: glycosyltransferase family 2 protein, partial [Nitrospinae bacterium]|nr:glycosyltransferase family 2 protein [Nitrospinota bacterium]
TDSFCGFKGYRIEALSKLSLTEQGYGMPLQLWIQACKEKLKVAEKATKRIYSNVGRIFGGELDDPEKRFIYYKKIMEVEIHK